MELSDGGAGGASGESGSGGSASAALFGDGVGGAAAAAAGSDAAAAGGASADGAASAPIDDPSWYANLSADPGEGDAASLRDWVKSIGVKDLDGLAQVARDNQRALRDSGRVKMPGENATDEERASWNKAIGVPDAPAGYELRGPEGEDGQPVPLNEGLTGPLAESAHRLGIPKAALEGLVQDFVKAQQDQIFAADKAERDASSAWIKAQGNEGTSKIAAIDRAAEALGLGSSDLLALRNALGAAKALPLLARLGEGMGEDRFIDGGRMQFGVSGEQAKQELATLKADPVWISKATKPGTPENAQYNRLVAAEGAEADRLARAG